MAKRRRLILFVWEDVLRDYTAGCMFALAYDADEARELLMPGYKDRKGGARKMEDEDLDKDPLVVEKPQGFKVWGGA